MSAIPGNECDIGKPVAKKIDFFAPSLLLYKYTYDTYDTYDFTILTILTILRYLRFYDFTILTIDDMTHFWKLARLALLALLLTPLLALCLLPLFLPAHDLKALHHLLHQPRPLPLLLHFLFPAIAPPPDPCLLFPC